MEGLKQIIDRITYDAEQEANAILEKAQQEAESILNHYRHEAESQKSLILDLGRTNAAVLIDRTRSKAEMDARKALLAAKQTLIDEVLTSVERHLLHLPIEAYQAFLVRLAIGGSQTGTETLIMNADDRKTHGIAVVAGANAALMAAGKIADLTLSDQVRPMIGGLILKKGPIETICTFEVLIQTAKRTQTAEIARILFDI